MNKLALLAALLSASLASCRVYSRTVGNPEPRAFMELDPSTATRDTLMIALGSPQGRGIRRVGDIDQELLAFNSYKGEFYRSGEIASGELLYAIVAIDADGKVPFVFGWQFGALGEEGRQTPRVRFSGLLSEFKVGETTRSQVDERMLSRGYVGRRVDLAMGISHELQAYTIHRRTSEGLVEPPRHLVLGFDRSAVLRDFLWWSYNPSDFSDPGEFAKLSYAKVTTIDEAEPFPVVDLNSASLATPLDFERIDALLRARPTRVEQIEAVLGPPNSRGQRQFAGEEHLAVACWEHQSVLHLGREHRVYPRAPDVAESGNWLLEPETTYDEESYSLLDVTDARLMVFSRADGTIEELVWVKPERRPGS